MAVQIDRLDIQGFRGIRLPTGLIFEGKSVLLFGENGTGKSSFVDALERLLTGRISTLDSRGATLSSSRHGPHIRSQDYPQHISIVLTNGSKTSIDLTTAQASLPLPVQQYLGDARANLFILRRRQLLDFVESQPRDRYALLRPFLQLESVEAWEASLRDLRTSLTRQAQAAVATESALRADLLRLTGLSDPQVLTSDQVLTAATQALEPVGRPPARTFDDVRAGIRSLADAIASFGDMDLQARLSTASLAISQFQEAVRAVDLPECVDSLRSLRERERREAHNLYEAVLAEGALWINQESRDSCPLCEQPISRHTVLARISERLGTAKELLHHRTLVKASLDTIRHRVTSALDSLRTVQRALHALAIPLDARAADSLNVLALYLAALQQASSSPLHDTDLRTLESLTERQREAHDALVTLVAVNNSLEQQRLAASSQIETQRLLNTQQLLRHLLERWESFEEAHTSSLSADLKSRTATQLLEAAERARKDEVQRLFDDLSADVDQIYRELHPDEHHGNLRLELREAVQRSVNLKADFYDRPSEDPRAYYSEAHLDTLGIAIFLALRRWHFREHPTFNLMVLDDVLTSIDAAHAARLAELLLREFRTFQVLLTTHDRIWFEHLRDIQARCGVAQNFVNKVIHKWTIDDGPDLREPEDERQELERSLSEGSAHQISVVAGRLLEHILQEMRYSLGLRVQAKRGEQYEIGDLWPAFYSEVKRSYPNLYTASRRALDALDVRWPIRNWLGAHWNTWARNTSRSSAVEFGRAVGDLFDVVFCRVCHRFVSPSPAPLGQLSCKCGTRLYPAAGKAAVPPKTREQLVQDTRGALRDATLNTDTFFRSKEAERQRDN